jgi:hypothetical protein
LFLGQGARKGGRGAKGIAPGEDLERLDKFERYDALSDKGFGASFVKEEVRNDK